MAQLLEVKYVRSAIGRNARQRRTIEALGLRKLNDSVQIVDNASVRGMIHAVRHLVTASEVTEVTEGAGALEEGS